MKCKEKAEAAGAAAAVTGVGLFFSLFGNVLQARNQTQLREEARRLWEDRERLRAALHDWQSAHSRMETTLRFTEASLRFLDEQNRQLKEQITEVRRQRDEALLDNQNFRRELDISRED